MTPVPSLVTLFVAPLNNAGIEYMVTGGLAAVIYGHPRLTLDIDLVVRLRAGDVPRFADLWSPDAFYSPPAEVILEESERAANGHFNVIHGESSMRADIYLAGTDELNDWALQQTVVREIDGVGVEVAPIEAVILGKLRYFAIGGSDRHLRDIVRMIEISGAEIDRAALDRWIGRMSLGDAWAKALEYRDDV